MKCHARVIGRGILLGALAGTLVTAPAHGATDTPGHPLPPERQTLPPGDGWASADGGTTGGAAADADHVYTVTDREELLAALGDGDGTPRVIRVKGTIDVHTDAHGNPLTCEDYARDGYTLERYLAAYDPAVWGTDRVPTGPLEDARAASAAAQRERIALPVGSHTTLVGVGDDARILGGSLQIRDADNVIVRNLTLEDTYDCFPQWDPTDGDTGNWNSEWDNAVVHNSTHVWFDHNTFTDGRRPDSAQPRYFGRPYQQHDGLLDIVRGADLVTVSWNVFRDHDKTILLGNSDSAGDEDRGRLRTTLHHNRFVNVTQRAPRVRFGQVDSYNNHFLAEADADYPYDHTYGIGIESALVAEYNAVTLPPGLGPADTLHRWTPGTSVTAHGNHVNGRPADLLAAYNAAHPEAPLGTDAGWTPTLRARLDHPRALPALLARHAGAVHTS